MDGTSGKGDGLATGDASCLDANVDYGHGSGFFVRVDVELPQATLYPGQRNDGGPMGFLSLTAEEAESLATKLAEMSRRVREKRDHGARHSDA